MILHEAIICTSTPATGSGSIAIHDIQTGSTLASFKQTTAGLHSTVVVPTQRQLGGLILAVQQDKALLNVYNFQKDQVAAKSLLPEKLSCLAIDCAGQYIAGGTAQGRIYIWELASGLLFNAWDAHYRKITVLKFTNDNAALLSGSEDSGLSVWSVSRLLDDDTQSDPPTPHCVLSDHTLPVTDIVCGIGSFPRCRALSASIDHSVKLWDLSSATLLTTFQFPQPISALAWDTAERVFFAAAPNGSVFQVNMFKERNPPRSYTAIGGLGSADALHVDDDEQAAQARRRRFFSVGEPVVALAISLAGTLLLTGTSAGSIHLFDITSNQLLRTISTHKGTSITHLSTMIRPPDLFGHVNLALQPTTSETVPTRSVGALQRMRDSKSREAHEIASILSSSSHLDTLDMTQDILRDHEFFVQHSSSASQDPASLQARVSELETEIDSLRDQLSKAKGLNDAIWEGVVHKVVLGKDKDDEAPAGRKKRGRIS